MFILKKTFKQTVNNVDSSIIEILISIITHSSTNIPFQTLKAN